MTVHEAGLGGASDLDVLRWAAEQERIVLSHDRQTMAGLAFARITAGKRLPGLFVIDDRAAVGRVIDDLLLIEDGSEHGEWVGRVEFVPL